VSIDRILAVVDKALSLFEGQIHVLIGSGLAMAGHSCARVEAQQVLFDPPV